MSNVSIGVIFHPSFPPDRLIEYARRAEAGGIDELWLWEDCFWAGALTSAAVVLASTERIKVCIGLLPATVRNPLFTAMEITTLASLYPGRFIPGFGHGVGSWMTQIGAAPRSSMKALEETVTSVRALLCGENVTLQGDHVHLDQVQMLVTPDHVPPLYVGAMREKTLRLAGRVGDGTILTEMVSPSYVRWAAETVGQGMAEAERLHNRIAIFIQGKIDLNGNREAVRYSIAKALPSFLFQLEPLGIAAEAEALVARCSPSELAHHLPDEWIDSLSISGTPEQAAVSFQRFVDAGAGSIVLQPLQGDPTCLDEYIQHLVPLVKR
jgi:5,10-methylenetetrahydromethanopterin reductase